MSDSSDTAQAVANTDYLTHQPVLEFAWVSVFQPKRTIPSGVGGWGGSLIPARWTNVLLIAVRRPQYQTDEDAVRATKELLEKLGAVPRSIRTSTSLVELLEKKDPTPSPEILAIAHYLVLAAHDGRPDPAIESVLREHLPFTIEVHPDPSRTVYLDDRQLKMFRYETAMLLIGWLIAARDSV